MSYLFFDAARDQDYDEELEEDELEYEPPISPGKVARTDRLFGNVLGVMPASPPARRPTRVAPAPIQRKSAVPTGSTDDWLAFAFRPDLLPQDDAADQAARGSGTRLPDDLLALVEDVLGADLSAVRIHEGPQAEAMGALAYTQGTDVFFQPGLYDPSSERGLELLGHELAHVVQQAGGRVAAPAGPTPLAENQSLETEADALGARLAASARGRGPADVPARGNAPAIQATGGAVQRRRIPKVADLKKILPKAGANADANLKGVIDLIHRAVAEMSPQTQTRVLIHALNGFSVVKFVRFLQLPEREQCMRLVRSIHAIAPDTIVGDPALRDLKPRAGTNDAANIKRLVANAHKIFGAIASGTHDKSIGQVFGKNNIAAAKRKYAAGHRAMHRLHRANMIVTDRSGYNAEVKLGGLTNPRRLSLAAKFLDNPDGSASIVTMIHEAMHAGNGKGVTDKGYINQPLFLELPESVKLTNAAHYEVVPRRILALEPSYADKTFVPKKHNITGIEKSLRMASEELRKAWTVALNLHRIWVRIQQNPQQWSTLDLSTAYGVRAGLHFDQCMPFWSKVQKLTVHNKPNINATDGKRPTAPVTAIDVALSEAITRLIALAMKKIPKTEKEGVEFVTQHASWMEQAYAALSPETCRDVLLKIAVRLVGPITGPAERDLRAISQMAKVNGSFKLYLVARSPNAFKD